MTATLALVLGLAGTAVAQGPPRLQAAPVNWHGQAQAAGIGTGQIEGAQAFLRATDAGASVTVQTRDLEPGHAYTLWYVFINNPEACASSPCSAGDFFLHPDVDAQVGHGAGTVAGSSGRATFSAHLTVGPVEGWLPDRELKDPRTAEFHFVVNSHGPQLAEFMPDMIHTYRGGSSDGSPFPARGPAAAGPSGRTTG